MKIFPKQIITNEHCLTHEDIVKSKTNEKEIVQYIFNSGTFIQIKRWFFYRITINSKHPTSLIYFKSTSSRKNEQTRHLMHYKTTIHPFSLLNLFWEYVMAWVYLYMFIIYFLSTLYIFEEYLYLFHIRRCIGDIIYLIDLIHFFFEGYYDVFKHRTVLSLDKVAKRYLKSFFIIDLIALLPNVSLVVYIITRNPYIIYMRYFGLIRILRLRRLLNAFELFKNYKDFTSYHLKAIRCILIYFVIVLFLYSLMFILNYHIDRLTGARVIHDSDLDFISATLILFMVSQGLEPLHSKLIITVIIISYFFALCIHLFLHAQVFQVWNTFFSAKSKNEDLLNQFKEYINYRGLSVVLKDRILLYFKFKFQNNFYNERNINCMVSNTIKEEIMCNIVHNYLIKAYILKTLPRSILVKVVTRLRSEIFLPDDIVVISGKPAHCMYFVYYGKLAVYNNRGVEVAHIEDGDCFGEMDMLFHEELAHKLSRSFDMKDEQNLLETEGGIRRHQSMQRLTRDGMQPEHRDPAKVVQDEEGNLRITVKKTKPILGIAIEGGANTKHPLPRIININETGAAFYAGGLEVGQLILQVDGTRVDGLQHQDVARLIAECYSRRDREEIEFLVVEAKKSNMERKPTALIFLEA